MKPRLERHEVTYPRTHSDLAAEIKQKPVSTNRGGVHVIGTQVYTEGHMCQAPHPRGLEPPDRMELLSHSDPIHIWDQPYPRTFSARCWSEVGS